MITRRSFLKLCITGMAALAIPIFKFPKKVLLQEEQTMFPIVFPMAFPAIYKLCVPIIGR